MKVKRLLLVLVVLALTAAFVLPVAAQDAPTGTWLGTWPYAAPGTHNLNGFAAGGLNDNLGVTYRPLVTLTPAYFLWGTNEYIGLLADSWGFVDDNTAYEYHIKDGAMWSDGTPVTAQDVIDTFDIGRILNWTQWSFLTSVEAVDDSTVRFNFTENGASPNAERLILKEYVVDSATYGDLAAQARQVIADGAESGSDAWTAVATAIEEFRPETLNATGPYTYALSDVGEAFMTLHWQPNSLYSDSVKFGDLKLWAGETEVTTPLVLSGELAYATNVYPPATIQSFADQGLRLITTPRGYGPALLFNFAVPPFDNALVRQAMAYAINRDQSALLTNGLGAHGTIYLSGILDSVTPNLLSQETIDSLNRYEYNLDTAASLMEQAGYTRNADGKWADADGNTIDAEYTFPADFADFSAAARDATSQLNEFGFNITERALPWQEAAAAIRASDFELSVWSWGSGSPFAYANFNNPVRRWTTALAEDQTGLNLDIRNFDYNGEVIDLNDLILNVSSGLDLAAQQERADYLATLLNSQMLYIPLNEMLSVEPLNESSIAGAPADGDPIYLNPSNESFVVPLILDGTLHPAG
ncbi:MAG: ABC transporter substrate-binding protein [Anaerolineae bacterium]